MSLGRSSIRSLCIAFEITRPGKFLPQFFLIVWPDIGSQQNLRIPVYTPLGRKYDEQSLADFFGMCSSCASETVRNAQHEAFGTEFIKLQRNLIKCLRQFIY